MPDLLMGIDGGGSRTRVVAVDTTGDLRGFAESGGCNPEWNLPEDCGAHLHDAITQALANAGARISDVRGLVAGLAGLNQPSDEAWARRFIESSGVTAPSRYVNDRVVAHAGAFGGGPGILVIAGTGFVTFAVTDTEREIRAGDLGNPGAPGAIALVQQLLSRLAADEYVDSDTALVQEVLARLRLPDVHGLRRAMVQRAVRHRDVAQLAPIVTKAADGGTPLAQVICDRAVESAVRGIRVLGPFWEREPVPVALVGAVVRSPYIRTRVEAALKHANVRYELQDPILPPVGGAAILALRSFADSPDASGVKRLGLQTSVVYPP